MPLNLSDTNAAFAELLRLADGQINLVERALIEATREVGRRAPTFEAVKQKLLVLKRQPEERKSREFA